MLCMHGWMRVQRHVDCPWCFHKPCHSLHELYEEEPFLALLTFSLARLFLRPLRALLQPEQRCLHMPASLRPLQCRP